MKQLAAILLLILFVFNTIGYRLWIEYVQSNADINLEAKLDSGHYNDENLLTIKVPLSLPYQNNSKEYERVNGEVTINGSIYKYVKRKVYNDTLVLLCIPHIEKTKLQEKANDFFGKVNGLPANETNKKAEAFKQLLSDYDVNEQFKFTCIDKQASSFSMIFDAACVHQYIPLNDQPPEVAFS